MHGRGKRAAALVSDAATREGRCCLRVREASSIFFSHFPIVLIRSNSSGIESTRADLGRIGPYRSKLPIHAKIKKKGPN